MNIRELTNYVESNKDRLAKHTLDTYDMKEIYEIITNSESNDCFMEQYTDRLVGYKLYDNMFKSDECSICALIYFDDIFVATYKQSGDAYYKLPEIQFVSNDLVNVILSYIQSFIVRDDSKCKILDMSSDIRDVFYNTYNILSEFEGELYYSYISPSCSFGRVFPTYIPTDVQRKYQTLVCNTDECYYVNNCDTPPKLHKVTLIDAVDSSGLIPIKFEDGLTKLVSATDIVFPVTKK